MKITIDAQDKGSRADKFVEKRLKEQGFAQVSRNMIQDSVPEGLTVNGSSVKNSYRLKIGDEVEIDKQYWETFFQAESLSEEIVPQEGDLNILYEDNDIIVLIKPKGLVVHPGVGNKEGTLANHIKYYLHSKNGFDINMAKAGIVHRLDKGVSGIMVVAKNRAVQDSLKEQFVKRQVEKIYLAKVVRFKASELGTVSEENLESVLGELADRKVDYSKWFEASGYIGRSNIDRYKMEFKLYEFPGSKSAKSYILPVNDNQILIKIVTGRMHQIRATLYYYGYYIDGDLLYSPKGKCSSEKIMLESIYLSFIHPVTQKRMFFINQ